MSNSQNEVIISRWQLYPSRPRPGYAWKWTFETTGPDGRLFTNDSIVELRRVLKKRYGRDVVIVEPWKK